MLPSIASRESLSGEDVVRSEPLHACRPSIWSCVNYATVSAKGGQPLMRDAAPQTIWAVGGTVEGAVDSDQQIDEVVGPTVGEVSLGERPDPLVGVQLRCVGREVGQVETRVAVAEAVERVTAMGPRVVEEGDHRSREMPQQVAKELADLDVPDVVQVQAPVEVQFSKRGDGFTYDR